MPKQEGVSMSEVNIDKTDQYLTFNLGEEFYGIDVAKVKEVLELVPITRVPKTPEFMRGVINLRGSVVPVLDMRLKFEMEEAPITVDTCIIVLEVGKNGDQINLGVIADSVQEVIELKADQIEAAPRIGTRLDTDFIEGIGKYKESFLILLNVDRVFTTEELSLASLKQNPEAENNSQEEKINNHQQDQDDHQNGDT